MNRIQSNQLSSNSEEVKRVNQFQTANFHPKQILLGSGIKRGRLTIYSEQQTQAEEPLPQRVLKSYYNIKRKTDQF